jgi:hypothetical protein
MASNDLKLKSNAGGDDPFYPREGKTLTWSGVSMTVVSIMYLFFDSCLKNFLNIPTLII